MSAPPRRGVRRFLYELKRRKVFRVAAAYGAVGFGVLQLSDLLVPILGLSDTVIRVTALAIVLALPVVLAVAWALDITPEGIRWTGPAELEVSEGATPDARQRIWPIALVGSLATVLVLAAGWWALTGQSGRPAGTLEGDATLDDDVLTVLPFAVRGSSDVHYLGPGMVSLLSTKLDGAGALRTVDSRSVLSLVGRERYPAGDTGAALSLLPAFGSGLFVTGDIVEAAGRMQVSAALLRATGEEVAEATVEGPVDEVFDLVDRLTAQLLSGLRGGPAARVQRIATVTTSSVPALKAFLDGEDHFRNGRFAESMESFQHAAELDSLFALAYYRMSIAAEWNFDNQLANGAAEKAVALSDRLSERDRRILEAYRKRRQGLNAEAAASYRSILGTYPDEMEAWLDLSELLFHANPLDGKSITESREALERVLDFDPRHATALIHLSRIAAYERDAAALDSLTSRLLALEGGDRNLEIETLRAIGLGDTAATSAFVAQFAEAPEQILTGIAWSAAVFGGDLDVAAAASRALASPNRSLEARQLGYAQLAHLATAAGRPLEVNAALEALYGLSPGHALEHEAMLALLPFAPADSSALARLRQGLLRLDPAHLAVSQNPSGMFTVSDELHRAIRFYLLGLLAANLDEGTEALAYADSLDMVDPGAVQGSLTPDLALGIRAEVLRRRGSPEQALAVLEGTRSQIWYTQTTASPMSSQVRERFLRAELLGSLGRVDEARRWYRTIGELSIVDLPYRAEAQRRINRFEETGGGPGA